MAQTQVSSRAESVTQFLTVFLVFILILVLTYLTTRFVGGFQKTGMAYRNFQAIETYRIANGKYLQIVRIGEKYVCIGISKDNITNICELSEEEIVDLSSGSKSFAPDTFKNIIDKAKERIDKGGSRNEK